MHPQIFRSKLEENRNKEGWYIIRRVKLPYNIPKGKTMESTVYYTELV